MEGTHTSLSVWFWAAYLVASQTPGISAVQFQRQLGLSRYETAFQILHKLHVGMVRQDQDRIGGKPGEHVEADETWVGGRTRGEGRGAHYKTLVAAAVEVRQVSPAPSSIHEEVAATPDAPVLSWCLTGAPMRFAVLTEWTFFLKSFLVAAWKSFFRGGGVSETTFSSEFKISSIFQKLSEVLITKNISYLTSIYDKNSNSWLY